jgi:hypothetical protein
VGLGLWKTKDIEPEEVMVVMEGAATEKVEKIGKIEFTVRVEESKDDAEERRKRCVEALTRLLLATWRLERGQHTN